MLRIGAAGGVHTAVASVDADDPFFVVEDHLRRYLGVDIGMHQVRDHTVNTAVRSGLDDDEVLAQLSSWDDGDRE